MEEYVSLGRIGFDNPYLEATVLAIEAPYGDNGCSGEELSFVSVEFLTIHETEAGKAFN